MGNSAIGYRKPGTKPGTWMGAFVVMYKAWTPVIFAVFEDNMDFIGDGPPTCQEVNLMVQDFQEQGWKPMTREDIKKTAGIDS